MEMTTRILYPLRTMKKRRKKKATKRRRAPGTVSALKVGDVAEE